MGSSSNPVPSNRTEILFERALSLIMDEWGHSRDEALAWLNDDTADWTPRVRRDVELRDPATGMSPYIQVKRRSVVTYP